MVGGVQTLVAEDTELTAGHLIHSWFAAVCQSQITTAAPAAVEAPSASMQRPGPLPRRREVPAFSGLPPVTRNTATLCAGPLAESCPDVLDVPPVHRSVRVNGPPDRPTCAVVAVIVAVPLPLLNRPTATEPSDSGLDNTSVLRKSLPAMRGAESTTTSPALNVMSMTDMRVLRARSRGGHSTYRWKHKGRVRNLEQSPDGLDCIG